MITTISVCIIIAVSMTNDSTSSLLVKYRGVSDYYVCSDQWTLAYSDAVCQQLQHTSVYLSVLSHIRTLFSSSLGLELYSVIKVARRKSAYKPRGFSHFLLSTECPNLHGFVCCCHLKEISCDFLRAEYLF